jgi:hypothetical protein
LRALRTAEDRLLDKPEAVRKLSAASERLVDGFGAWPNVKIAQHGH